MSEILAYGVLENDFSPRSQFPVYNCSGQLATVFWKKNVLEYSSTGTQVHELELVVVLDWYLELYLHEQYMGHKAYIYSHSVIAVRHRGLAES